tara:strand:+ start:4675 stop:5010 length:336 start_codon:yes stop_codon:yes gene_type:complete
MSSFVATKLDEIEKERAQQREREQEKERQFGFKLTKAQVALLSAALGKNIMSAEDLVATAEKLSTINVEGVAVMLEPYLLNRLKSRCHPSKKFPEFLKETVIAQLSGYAGA